MLLVEDDLISASALKTILTRRGYDVTAVSTVKQALAQISENPAFVILDLMLPDGNGLTVLQTIREMNIPTRVLITTAMSDPDYLRRAQTLKPDAILPKPIDLTLLLNSLKPAN